MFYKVELANNISGIGIEAGQLLEMAGDHAAAIAHYRVASCRTTSIPEQS